MNRPIGEGPADGVDKAYAVPVRFPDRCYIGGDWSRRTAAVSSTCPARTEDVWVRVARPTGGRVPGGVAAPGWPSTGDRGRD